MRQKIVKVSFVGAKHRTLAPLWALPPCPRAATTFPDHAPEPSDGAAPHKRGASNLSGTSVAERRLASRDKPSRMQPTRPRALRPKRTGASASPRLPDGAPTRPLGRKRPWIRPTTPARGRSVTPARRPDIPEEPEGPDETPDSPVRRVGCLPGGIRKRGLAHGVRSLSAARQLEGN